MLAAKKSKLPKEYQEAEYLESTGTQYVDTEVLTSNNIRIIAKAVNTFAFEEKGNRYGAMLFGGRIANSSSNISYASGALSDYVGEGNGFLTIPSNSNRNILTVDWSNTEVQIFCGNYSYQSALNAQIANPRSIFLFSTNQSGVPEQGGSYRGIHFEMWNDNIKVRDFVPCYRKADNEPGMYDLCGSICPLTNSPFYINAGTGVFLVGDDVT